MTPYILLLAVVMVVAFLTRRSKTSGTPYYIYNGVNINIFGLIVIGLILCLFQGVRDITVGTDTMGYCMPFMEHTGRWDFNYQGLEALTNEPGAHLLYRVAGLWSDNYISLLIGSSIIMVICALYSIRMNCINMIAGLYTYITLAYYLFGFAAMRQALALGCLLIAFTFLFRRCFWKYALIVLIGALFHKTVIVALPFYILNRLDYNIKNIVIIAIIAMIIAYSMNTLVDWGMTLEERYKYYEEETKEGAGALLTLFSVCLTVFYMVMRISIPMERRYIYDISLFSLIIATSIYLIVTLTDSNTELNRFAMYFQISSIFLFSEYAASCKGKGINPILIGMIIIQFIYYCVYINKIGGIGHYLPNPIGILLI